MKPSCRIFGSLLALFALTACPHPSQPDRPAPEATPSPTPTPAAASPTKTPAQPTPVPAPTALPEVFIPRRSFDTARLFN
ncbi:MAG TPA: hypothetical protein VF585_10925, partial [Chthoniobacterales bacterium]